MFYEYGLFWLAVFMYLLGLFISWDDEYKVYRDRVQGGFLFFGMMSAFGMYGMNLAFGMMSVITGWITELMRQVLHILTISAPGTVLVGFGAAEHVLYFLGQMLVFFSTYLVASVSWYAGYLTVPVLFNRVPVSFPFRLRFWQPKVIPAEKGVMVVREVDGDYIIRQLAWLHMRLDHLEELLAPRRGERRGDGRAEDKVVILIPTREMVKGEVRE